MFVQSLNDNVTRKKERTKEMSKILIMVLAAVGTLFLINAYMHTLWNSGVFGVPWAVFLLLGVCYLAYRLKGK